VKGSVRDLASIPDQLRHLFVTALEISADRHLEIQAAFQRHVDNSVSKTINLSHEATAEEVARIYQRAWELELKGITIYRYGSRATQVLELGANEPTPHRERAARRPGGVPAVNESFRRRVARGLAPHPSSSSRREEVLDE